MRLPFTQSDIKHMIEWLVENAADGTTRTGNKLWKGLMNNPSASAWSLRHTWQSWRQRYLDRQAQYDLMINSELKKRRIPTVGSPLPFTQQDAKRLAWYFRTEEIPQENRSDIGVFKRLLEENKWEWCARHSDTEWQLLYSVKEEAINALAASDEPLDYAVPTPAKGDTVASRPMASSKRPRPSEFTSPENGAEEHKTKKRRFNEASASASQPTSTPAAPTDGHDPTLVSSLVSLQAKGNAPNDEQPGSGAEPVAEAQTTEERETFEERDIHPADGEIEDVLVVPESIREPSLFLLRSPSIQLVSSSKPPKQKWRLKAFNAVTDDDYFETAPSSPNTRREVVDPAPVSLNQDKAQADATSQRGMRQEGAEDVGSPDLDFEEVDFQETAVGTFEHLISHPEEVTAITEPQAFSPPVEETSTTAANGIISDNEYQHTMPQHADVPDVFSNSLVGGRTRPATGSSLATPSKSQRGPQPVMKGLTSGHLDQRDPSAHRDTLSFDQVSETRRSVDEYSQSPLPSSSAPNSPVPSIPPPARMGVNASSYVKVAKRNGEGNRADILKSGPAVSGPHKKARPPPRGVPIPVRDSSPIRRSSPPQPRADRRRTFGGWPTVLATSSLRKEEATISNPRRERRDSTPALPATMLYRNQQQDADWLRGVEKKIKVIPRYTDPRKRSIPLLPPDISSDDTNTANESEDEDGLAEKVSRMSSRDIERVMNVLNVAPRNKVLKQWKQQNKSDAWIIWNGLDFVLEELANRFNTGVIAAREAWATAGDLVVTEKALYHAQETTRRTIADVIKSEAEEASKRRMESWAPSREPSKRWGSTSRRNSRVYQRGARPPEFVPTEAVQVAVGAASSLLRDHDVRQRSSDILRNALEELPMLSFDGVGPGGVTILRE